MIELELFTSRRHVPEDPFRIAKEIAHHVKDVRAEDDEVFTTGAAVFLAAASQFLDLTDLAGRDHFLGL